MPLNQYIDCAAFLCKQNRLHNVLDSNVPNKSYLNMHETIPYAL